MGADSWHADQEGRQWCASVPAREILHYCNDHLKE